MGFHSKFNKAKSWVSSKLYSAPKKKKEVENPSMKGETTLGEMRAYSKQFSHKMGRSEKKEMIEESADAMKRHNEREEAVASGEIKLPEQQSLSLSEAYQQYLHQQGQEEREQENAPIGDMDQMYEEFWKMRIDKLDQLADYYRNLDDEEQENISPTDYRAIRSKAAYEIQQQRIQRSKNLQQQWQKARS